jgi:hypothetical protein
MRPPGNDGIDRRVDWHASTRSVQLVVLFCFECHALGTLVGDDPRGWEGMPID